ncbi:MAG: hypothetical protein IT317_10700 [Anaerolineales bacterium]|nr:hypothetical protein [Anaerolineales bacterium]
MQQAIETILNAHDLTEAFSASREFHLKLENLPYMPLVIERQGDEVAVMHFFIQQGDVMADPELTFRLWDWTPTSITQHPVGVYRQVFMFVNGRQVVNTRLLHELEGFARLWAINLRAQGFLDALRVTATSLTHPDLVKPRVPA